MRENNRKPIERCRKRLSQFTTMNVIDGQAGLVIYSSLIFYSLTIDNILNIIVLLILAGVSISTLTGPNGLLTRANDAKEETRAGAVQEARDLWFAEKNMNKQLNQTTAKTLEDLINELVNDKYLTEDEKDNILGNASKGIKAQHQIKIGNRVINFKDDENSEPDYANLEAGLYETGTSKMIKSWEQLINDGSIYVTETYLYDYWGALKGDLVIKEGIKEIDNLFFSTNCGGTENVTGLVTPSTMQEVLVSGNDTLEKVFIKDGAKLVHVTGRKLKYIRLPETLEIIDDYGFGSGLESIKLPNNLKHIGKSAFENCSNLKEVKCEFSVFINLEILDGNEILKDVYCDKYFSYAEDIIKNLSADENIRNQEITDIYIDGFTYIEKARGNIPEDVKIENLQDLWENVGQQGQCPFNNVVEAIEAEGGTYEKLISMMIEQFYVKPKEFDQNN